MNFLEPVTEQSLIAAFQALGECCPDGGMSLFRDSDTELYFVASRAECDPLIGPADPAGVLAQLKRWHNRLTNEQHIRFSGTSSTKSRTRGRPCDPAVARRRDAIVEIVRAAQPATVRQVYYLAETRGLVPKTEEGYRRVQNDLALLRREAAIPFSWITDGTRWQRKPRTFGGIDEALCNTAETYRKALWRTANVHCEIWVEKDALTGVIYPVTALYDVPLYPARGYSSISLLHDATEFADLGVPVYVYHLGDYDPSGQDAARAIEKSLREFAPETEIHFKRLALTPDQISAWSLPTRPTKATDTRARKFGSDFSAELDAIPPEKLRTLVQDAIELHLPRGQLDVLKVAEANERELLQSIVAKLHGAGSAA